MELSIKEEVDSFVEKCPNLCDKGSSVLIWRSPLNSYERLQIHQIVQSRKEADLLTFSVGKSFKRRLCIAFKVLVEKSKSAKKGNATTSKDRSSLNSKAPSSNSSRSNKRPDRAVYVPPGAARQQLPSWKSSPSREDSENAKRPRESATEDETKFSIDSDLFPSEYSPSQILQEVFSTSLKIHYSDLFLEDLKSETRNDEENAESEESLRSKVVEIYDFDTSLLTRDIQNELSDVFKLDNYDLRWVDDNHAIVFFHDAEDAKTAASKSFKRLKVRSIAEADEISVQRAEAAGYFDASKAPRRTKRPATSTLVAKRMMGGALGVSLVSKGEKVSEMNKIRDAKNDKR